MKKRASEEGVCEREGVAAVGEELGGLSRRSNQKQSAKQSEKQSEELGGCE